LQPDLIILASSPVTLERLASGAEGPDASAEYETGLLRTIEEFQPSGARIVILQSPPAGSNIQDCYTAVSTPRDCAYGPTPASAPQKVVHEAVAAATGVELIDPTLWFCTQAAKCPSFVGTTSVRVDTNHITPEYAERLAPVMMEALFSPR
jgi:hypothetical protein